MKRLIDLQTALDLLENDINENGEPTESDYNIGINHARCVISTIPSAQLIDLEPQWIPVSERLPDPEKGIYWVCTDDGGQHECRWTNVNTFWTNLTTDWHWNIFDIPQFTKVVAWMELPKPYREG